MLCFHVINRYIFIELKMETQLEIVCKQNSEFNIDNSNSPNNNSRWSGFQSIINKLRESIKQEKHFDDDWEIPFERIRMYQNDFQRCGSQGDVFYGKLDHTPVAVKRVKDKSLTIIRHLHKLNHTNIIQFRGISEDFKHYYIVMEWCPYGTLHDHIHKGLQISPRILSDFCQQIVDGMEYVHSKNIIHGDVKPSNILVTHNDVLKISDFGAHIVVKDKLPVTSYAGTLAYMAPEVIRNEPCSFSIDVWSYGVVLWEMLIGDEPYKNLDSYAVAWAVGNDSFHLPIPPSFPKGFSFILKGCWKTQPKERLSFKQISMILKGAKREVDEISKERWLALQAGWKQEVRDELNKHFQLKTESNEDQFIQEKQAWIEALKQAQKRRNRNNELFLKLQECSMHLQREREDVARCKEIVLQREAAVAEREKAVAQMEAHLKEQISLISKSNAIANQ